jgi:hypothetical protein
VRFAWCYHSYQIPGVRLSRHTGITACLKNGGTRQETAAMANHASTRTMQLYERRSDEAKLDEVERAEICENGAALIVKSEGASLTADVTHGPEALDRPVNL